MTHSTMPNFGPEQFRKSTASGQDPQACVEVARAAGWVAIRDSKLPWRSPADRLLVFSAAQFDAYLDGARRSTQTSG
jgi:Domain of unknown function (DUF397)